MIAAGLLQLLATPDPGDHSFSFVRSRATLAPGPCNLFVVTTPGSAATSSCGDSSSSSHPAPLVSDAAAKWGPRRVSRGCLTVLSDMGSLAAFRRMSLGAFGRRSITVFRVTILFHTTTSAGSQFVLANILSILVRSSKLKCQNPDMRILAICTPSIRCLGGSLP
jgi:hypothetical protein